MNKRVNDLHEAAGKGQRYQEMTRTRGWKEFEEALNAEKMQVSEEINRDLSSGEAGRIQKAQGKALKAQTISRILQDVANTITLGKQAEQRIELLENKSDSLLKGRFAKWKAQLT